MPRGRAVRRGIASRLSESSVSRHGPPGAIRAAKTTPVVASWPRLHRRFHKLLPAPRRSPSAKGASPHGGRRRRLPAVEEALEDLVALGYDVRARPASAIAPHARAPHPGCAAADAPPRHAAM